MDTLQNKINKTRKGDALELHNGEYHEEIKIIRNITICSHTDPITIVGKSPTVSIESKKVILENMNLVSTDDDNICLSVKKNCNPTLKNVFVKGQVVGLDGEENNWEIPNVLELAIIPNKETRNKFIMYSPVTAKIYPSEAGVITCIHCDLKPGHNEVIIKIKEIREGNIISDDLIIETPNYNLKRKISLYGNTLDSNADTSTFDGKLIWVCESAASNINADLIKKLPEGKQREPYEFLLDVEQLGCEEYIIFIDNLPDGLKFFSSPTVSKIKGIPKTFGEFEMKFRFQKEDREYTYPAKLNIKENVVVPLEAEHLEVSCKEGDTIKEKIKITSSNSPDITFQAEKNLPNGLSLNESTGELHGKISEHGSYVITIKISDGTNEISYQTNLNILPKEPLKVSLKNEYEVYKDEEFTIPISIEDAEKLSPKVKFLNPLIGQITFSSHDSQIKGKIDEIKVCTIEIEVEDIYKRTAKESFTIRCIEKPSYKIRWKTPTLIERTGKRGNVFTEPMMAEIEENKKLKLEYFCVGSLPANFKLENGTLEGIIDGKEYSIKIKAECKNYSSEKEFVIITKIASSHLKKQDIKATIRKSLWNFSTKNKETGTIYKDSFKDQLLDGEVDSPYKDSLIINNFDCMENININVSDLPDGLMFNSEGFIVEGTPLKAGINILKVNINNKNIKEVKLKINKPLFNPNNENNSSKPKKTRQPKLGPAF